MKDDLDLLLDRSLETYSAVEPSPDLAEAILRRSQTAVPGVPKKSSRVAWTFALAVPAAAVLILVVMLAVRFGLPYSAPASKLPERAAQVPARAPLSIPARHVDSTNVESEAVRRPSFDRPRVSHSSAAGSKDKERAPERDFYLVPASPEERALVEFVQQHPQEAAAIAEQQKHALDPLHEDPIAVAPIEIKPITIAAID